MSGRQQCLLVAAMMLVQEASGSESSLRLAGRYDHGFTSTSQAFANDMVSTSQLSMASRMPLGAANAYLNVATRIGPGYTSLGSRGAELGYDQGRWFVSAGQSTGTELSWITANAWTGNIGNLSLLSAFPRDSVTVGLNATQSNAIRYITHRADPARPNPERGQEWSWVHRRESHTVRLAQYRQFSGSETRTDPVQSGVSYEGAFGRVSLKGRYTEITQSSGERLYQAGMGFRTPLGPSVDIVVDALTSRSSRPERDAFLGSGGVTARLSQYVDAYLLGFHIRNDEQSNRFVGAASAQSMGGRPTGLAIGLRVSAQQDF